MNEWLLNYLSKKSVNENIPSTLHSLCPTGTQCHSAAKQLLWFTHGVCSDTVRKIRLFPPLAYCFFLELYYTVLVLYTSKQNFFWPFPKNRTKETKDHHFVHLEHSEAVIIVKIKWTWSLPFGVLPLFQLNRKSWPQTQESHDHSFLWHRGSNLLTIL